MSGDTINPPLVHDYDVVVRSTVPEPTLSVIVAIYNMEQNGYLEDCLASFDAQCCEQGRIEYVLANDCSSDGSLALAVRWAQRRDDTTVIHLHKNMRQGTARNRAICESRGKWFAIVDADDYVSPDYFAAIIASAIETGADAIVSKSIQDVDWQGRPLSPMRRNIQDSAVLGEMDESKIRRAIIRHWQFGAWPRRLFVDKQNWFLEGIFYEDTPVSVRWILQLKSVSETRGGVLLLPPEPQLNAAFHVW